MKLSLLKTSLVFSSLIIGSTSLFAESSRSELTKNDITYNDQGLQCSESVPKTCFRVYSTEINGERIQVIQLPDAAHPSELAKLRTAQDELKMAKTDEEKAAAHIKVSDELKALDGKKLFHLWVRAINDSNLSVFQKGYKSSNGKIVEASSISFKYSSFASGLSAGRETLTEKSETAGRDVRHEFEFLVSPLAIVAEKLVGSSLEESADVTFDEKIPDYARGQIRNMLAMSDAFKLIPDSTTKDLLLDKTAAAAYEVTLASQVRAQKEAILTNIDTRLSDLQKNLAVQRLSYVMSVGLTDNARMIVNIGRSRVEGGFILNTANQTEVEAKLVTNLKTFHFNDTFAANNIGAAIALDITETTRLFTQVVASNTKVAFYDAVSFIGNAITRMSEADFKRLVNFTDTKLDTFMIRAVLESEYLDLSFSAGQFDTKHAVQTGVVLKLSKYSRIFGGFGTGNRDYSPTQTYAFGAQHDTQIFGLPITLSAVHEVSKDFSNPAISFLEIRQQTENSVQMVARVLNRNFIDNKVNVLVQLGLKCAHNKYNLETIGNEKEIDCSAGLYGQATFGH